MFKGVSIIEVWFRDRKQQRTEVFNVHVLKKKTKKKKTKKKQQKKTNKIYNYKGNILLDTLIFAVYSFLLYF